MMARLLLCRLRDTLACNRTQSDNIDEEHSHPGMIMIVPLSNWCPKLPEYTTKCYWPIIGGECAISVGLVARVFMHGDERKCTAVGLAKEPQSTSPAFYAADANQEFSSVASSAQRDGGVFSLHRLIDQLLVRLTSQWWITLKSSEPVGTLPLDRVCQDFCVNSFREFVS